MTAVDFYHVALARFLQGFGTALFFMPILVILLSDLEGPEVAEGSGVATFLRTVGASFSASITTYLWTRGGSVSHANLAAHINACSAGVRDGIASVGGALDTCAVAMNRAITQQAMQVSFNNLFNALGFIFLALIGVVWLAKPPFIARRSGGPARPAVAEGDPLRRVQARELRPDAWPSARAAAFVSVATGPARSRCSECRR